jgi:hypothetical protein
MEHPSSDLPTEPKRQKARSLKDILLEFGPIREVSYEPFKIKAKRLAKPLLYSTFLTKPHPYDYFTLFFTRDLF